MLWTQPCPAPGISNDASWVVRTATVPGQVSARCTLGGVFLPAGAPTQSPQTKPLCILALPALAAGNPLEIEPLCAFPQRWGPPDPRLT